MVLCSLVLYLTLSAGGDALYGIKFDYCKQKDAYADLEFLNDVGCSADNVLFS